QGHHDGERHRQADQRNAGLGTGFGARHDTAGGCLGDRRRGQPGAAAIRFHDRGRRLPMTNDRVTRIGRHLLAAHFALVLGFLLIPVLMVIPMSFSETRYLKFPPSGFTFNWYAEFFSSTTWI